MTSDSTPSSTRRGHVRAERLAAPIGRRSGIEQPQTGRRRGVPRNVAVPEHQHVGVGVLLGHPRIPARGPAGFVDDREPHVRRGWRRHVRAAAPAVRRRRCCPSRRRADRPSPPVNRASAGSTQSPACTTTSARATSSHTRCGRSRARFGHVGVGDQQQPHGQLGASSSAIFGISACRPLSGRTITLNGDDLLGVVPVDHVDAVDVLPVDGRGELENRRTLAVPLLDVVKVGAAEHLRRRGQIRQGRVAAFLRREHGRRVEHGVLGEQALQFGSAAVLDDVDPACDHRWRHVARPYRQRKDCKHSLSLVRSSA